MAQLTLWQKPVTESKTWNSCLLWDIFYLDQFTQNITYLIIPFIIHMPDAEGTNIAQWWAKI